MLEDYKIRISGSESGSEAALTSGDVSVASESSKSKDSADNWHAPEMAVPMSPSKYAQNPPVNKVNQKIKQLQIIDLERNILQVLCTCDTPPPTACYWVLDLGEGFAHISLCAHCSHKSER
jgi:hypothetical protein